MNRAKSKASNENCVERKRKKVGHTETETEKEREREWVSEAKGALGINGKEPCRFVVVDMFDACV